MWAGLLHNEENLTEQQVGNLIDMDCLNEIFEKRSGTLSEDLPARDESADEPMALPN